MIISSFSKCELNMKIKYISITVSFDGSLLMLKSKGFAKITGNQKVFCLFLNKNLTWKKIAVKNDESLIDLPYQKKDLPENSFFKVANYWEIQIPSKNNLNSPYTIIFEYEGTIEPDPWGTNYIESDFIELGCYSPWYPIISLDDYPSFEIIVNADSEWEWITNSNSKINSHHWRQPLGDSDLTLLGVKQTKAITKADSNLFWGYKEHLSTFQDLEPKLQEIFQILETWLGPPEFPQFHIALTKRTRGGTYVRKTLIVTQIFTRDRIKERYPQILRSWSHEFAHNWFNKASTATYDNWIDEALAEFTSLLVCKQLFGKDHFNQRLHEFKTKILNEPDSLPAISSILRSHSKAHLVYYTWGSLIVSKIYRQLGEKLFLKVIKGYAEQSFKKHANQTQLFIDILKKYSEHDWNTFMKHYLSIEPKQGLSEIKQIDMEEKAL